jgi:hypothetical protein
LVKKTNESEIEECPQKMMVVLSKLTPLEKQITITPLDEEGNRKETATRT